MDSALNFIDIHYHADPDLYDRKYSAFDAARRYQALNGAVVLKSHLGSTSAIASAAQHEGFNVFPSIVLNPIAGGVHYRAILQALAEYHPVIPSKLIVHFPTHTGRKHASTLSRQLRKPEFQVNLFQPETIFDENNQLKSNVIDILKCAKDYPIVLSTGHASKNEVYALAEACAQFQVPHLLLNQPANPMTGLSAEELLALTQQYDFIWTEQTALTYLLQYQSQEDFYKVLNTIPRVIYASDLGQTSQMDIDEWLQKSDDWFLAAGMNTERRNEICLHNPKKLILSS